MLSKYIKISELCSNPELYNQKCVQSTARIKNRPFYSSSNGSSKYTIELNSTTEVGLIISIWKKPPSWLPYSITSEYLLRMFEPEKEMKTLFLPGEDLFFEGFVIKKDDTIWINVEKIIIISPSTVIGSREVISYITCERKYYLDYIKNVKHNILSYPNKYITRGNIAHRVMEKILVEGTYFELFNLLEDEKNRRLKEIIMNTVDSEYRLDLALHSMASNSIDYILNDVFRHTIGLISDAEVYEFFRDKKIKTEVQLNNTFGFYGFVDFLVEELALEFKSSANAREDHKIQLKIYLLNTYLSRSMRRGYLLYSQPTKMDESDSICRRLHSINLEDEDIGELLYARHSILLQRRGMYLPTTYNKPCYECKYKEHSDHSLQHYFPICQFYCQTERYWECYSVDESGKISTNCYLFLTGLCPLNESYFDVNVIDFFNKTRRAIQIENEMQNMIKNLLNNISPESLELCGQRINNLKFVGKKGPVLTFKRNVPLPQLDLSNGDYVSIKTEDDTFSYRGSLKSLGFLYLEVKVEGNFEDQFFSYDTYSLIKEYSEIKSLRYLLGVVDYIQRSKHNVELMFPKDEVISCHNIPAYDPEEVERVVPLRKIVGVQIPSHHPLIEMLKDVIYRIKSIGKILIIFNSDDEIKRYIEQCEELNKFLVLNRMDFPENPKPWEIGAHDSSDIIVEKILNSEIILTDYNFILENHFFELLHNNSKKKFFDLLILTHAERAFDPLFFYFRSLADRILMFGDAQSISYPFKSNEARESLGKSTFEKLIKSYSYFESKFYSVLCQPFDLLPEQTVKVLRKAKMDMPVRSYGGDIVFVDVNGLEKTASSINYEYSVSMKSSSLTYRLDLKSKGNCEIYKLPEKLEELRGKSIDSYEKGEIISLSEDYFEISGKLVEGKNREKIENNVKINVSFLAGSIKQLSELMYYNETEAYEVINLIKTIRPRHSPVIVTPFLSQASLIRSYLFEEGIEDVPVLLPYKLAGKHFDVAIVSFVNANDENLIRWPLSDLKLLYMLLTSANDKLFLIGDKRTLYRNRILREIIESPNTVHLQGVS
ncbi:AAA domain-containing protein [Methanosarcina sp. Mfa9]|uniref:AAA domain-containing protein n=1 Tax=Methanosarcina sp. Mfa9 TaxID=3439063 RepID=UPI003F87B916